MLYGRAKQLDFGTPVSEYANYGVEYCYGLMRMCVYASEIR